MLGNWTRTETDIYETYNSDESVSASYVDLNNCGCKIGGAGTYEQPLFIKYCVAHSSGYAMFAKWEHERNATYKRR